LKKIEIMKLSSSLLQAITLGVTVTTLTATATSCEKQKFEQNQERIDAKTGQPASNPTHSDCPACGMG
jgi:hypothetical protein